MTESDSQETQQSNVIDRVSDAIVSLNSDLEFTFANPQAEQLLDETEDSLRGTYIWNAFPEVADTVAEQKISAALETGQKQTFERYNEELERWFEARVYPDEDGVSVFFTDISERKERELELERYEQVIETLPVAVGINTPGKEGRFEFVNQAAVEMLGASSKSELQDYTPRDAYANPDERKRVSEQVRETGTIEQYEVQLTTLDGETFWGSMTAELTEIDGTEYIIGIIEDVSERKRRVQELEAKTRAIEAAPIGVTLSNPQQDDNPLIYVNERFEEMTGYAAEEVYGRNCRFLQGDDTAEEPVAAMRDAIDAEESVTVELRNYRKDGDQFWNRVSIAPVRTEDGLSHFVGFQQDITERKEYEVILEELHDATRGLMTATTTEEVASIGSETATQVLDLPMNGVHLYDEDADELVPVAWADRSEDILDDAPPALPVGDSLAGRVYRTGELEFHADVREADGVYDTETPFRSDLLLPLGDHGVFVVTSPVVDDFDGTDERLAKVLAANIETALNRVRQYEELQRERDRLDEFASVVSHDLRSPLHVASGRLDLARQECNSDHLDDVADAHDRMDSLIEDLLALARSGQFAGDREPVDLAAAVEDCWPPVERARAAATLRVETDDVIRADSERLQQLLENLLRNAVEHGGDGVTVTVGDLVDVQGFYVADDGPGIPEDEHDEVFEAGYSTTDEGTGFGLNIVHEIAEAHGWNITVTDSETGGARFEITGVETSTE